MTGLMMSQLTEELDTLDKLLLLGEVDEDDGLDIAAVRRVAEDTECGKEDGNEDHDARESARELFRLLHRLGDGDDTGENEPGWRLNWEKVAYSPMPSNANTAVPMRRGKLSLLNIMTSATPWWAMVPTSHEAM